MCDYRLNLEDNCQYLEEISKEIVNLSLEEIVNIESWCQFLNF
jgi:hypothetical protein